MKIDIQHIAILANLSLTQEQAKKFEEQLSETLDYVKALNKIDTNNVLPTSQVTGLENVMRDDVATPSLSQEQALQNAKENTYNGLFKVPAILEQ